MSKIRRYHELGTIYFLTAVTKNRKSILEHGWCRQLISIIGCYKVLLNFRLYGFCILPNHFHLLIEPMEEQNNISKIMMCIKGKFAAKYNKATSSEGSVWQQSFYDTAVRDTAKLNEFLKYIHYNPVKANLVKDQNQYEFSSLLWYLGKAPNYLIDII